MGQQYQIGRPHPRFRKWFPSKNRRTARSLNGPSRINRLIPKRTTGSKTWPSGAGQHSGATHCHQPNRWEPVVLWNRRQGYQACVRRARARTHCNQAKRKRECRPLPRCRCQVPGGVAIDSNGVVWQDFRGAHQMMSFDRRKCKVLNGPEATGQHCPEGRTVYKGPDPRSRARPTI
jgi:hypothetical protein